MTLSLLRRRAARRVGHQRLGKPDFKDFSTYLSISRAPTLVLSGFLALDSGLGLMLASRALLGKVEALVPKNTNKLLARLSASASSSPAMEQYPHGLKTLSLDSTMALTINRLGTDIKEVALLEASAFVKPQSVIYKMDGLQRRWDVVESHSSVGIVLYNSDLDSFIIVRQFRPAVWMARSREAAAQGQPAPDLESGFTHELCAGLVDKAKPLAHICSEEVAEECGYALPADQLHPVTSSVASAGITGANHTIFYGRVDESMRIGQGGGLDGAGEAIEVLALPFENTYAFVMDSSIAKSPGLLFGLLWAFHALQSGQLPGRSRAALETEPLVLKSVIPA